MSARKVTSPDKPCKACGEIDRRPNGRCRPCAAKREKAWRAAHPEDVAAANAAWARRNAEARRGSVTKWRTSNPEAFREAKRRWINKPGSREKTRETYRAWVERNRAAKNIAWNAWRDRNPQAARAIRARVKAKRKGAAGSHSVGAWIDLLASYHGLCAYCGAAATTRDHVIPLARGGDDSIENIVPACLPCNAKKRHVPMLVFLASRTA